MLPFISSLKMGRAPLQLTRVGQKYFALLLSVVFALFGCRLTTVMSNSLFIILKIELMQQSRWLCNPICCAFPCQVIWQQLEKLESSSLSVVRQWMLLNHLRNHKSRKLWPHRHWAFLKLAQKQICWGRDANLEEHDKNHDKIKNRRKNSKCA